MFRHSPLWFQVLLWAAIAVTGAGFGVWFTFFALFPRPSFHIRWIWAVVWLPISLVSMVLSYQVWHFIYGPEHMIPSRWMNFVFAVCWVTYMPASFAVLAIKYRRLRDKTEKRRVRLFVLSLAFAVTVGVPVVVYSFPEYLLSPGASVFRSLPVRALAALVGAAFPLCFAYAILRHRLFDIRQDGGNLKLWGSWNSEEAPQLPGYPECPRVSYLAGNAIESV
jgi:hypothetical protein